MRVVHTVALSLSLALTDVASSVPPTLRHCHPLHLLAVDGFEDRASLRRKSFQGALLSSFRLAASLLRQRLGISTTREVVDILRQHSVVHVEAYTFVLEQRSFAITGRSASPRGGCSTSKAAQFQVGCNHSVSWHLSLCSAARGRHKRVLLHALAHCLRGSTRASSACNLAVRRDSSRRHCPHEGEDAQLEVG